MTGAVRATSPLGLLRSKPGSVPLPHPRRATTAPAARSAAVSLRSRTNRAARGRAVQPSGFFDRIREDDARHGAGQPSEE